MDDAIIMSEPRHFLDLTDLPAEALRGLCYIRGMLLERTQNGIRLVPHRSFAGLMTLYEGNYQRLRRLIPELARPPARACSMVDGDLDLYLETLERCPYTTTLRLTYWFESDGAALDPDPDLIVRVYHDARMAEATSCRHYHRHRVLRPFLTPGGEEVSRRWSRNLMFHKWLEFCLEHGHRLTHERETV
jgi:uncharacterized protein